jgi:hypothetical protein
VIPFSRTALAAAASALLVVGLAAPVMADPPAIHRDNKPTPLAGTENGYVPDDRLITVAPGCRVAREAAPSLALLLRTASSAKVRLGTRSCYRPISGQVAVASSWTARGNSACAATVERHPDGRPKGTSNHGWGKAVDFSEASPMSFSSPGFRFLQAHAGRLGWNHPGWAKPGGGPCPEPWHWEWVGDGGTMGLPAVRADVVSVLPGAASDGHAVVTGLGGVRPRGTAVSHGSAESVPLHWVVVGAAATPARDGYWLLGGDGGIFSFGRAAFHGSTGAMRLNAPVVAMAATPGGSGGGYWLVAADGGIFSFGNAAFHGSTGAMRLNSPIVGMAATPDGGGYWLVAADGGIFTFGNAPFLGSAADDRLATPVVAMASTPRGDGYWIAAADGTVVARGAAR